MSRPKTTDLFSLYWQKGNGGQSVDITRFASEICWSESNNSHTMKLKFSVPDSEQRYLERHNIEAGDKILLFYDNEMKYCFIVADISRNYPKRQVNCYDFGFYIEKNDIVIQFTGQTVKKACEMVCGELGIECKVCEMTAPVNGVYIDSAENIIEKLLDLQKQTDGFKYSYEMAGDKLRIYRLPTEAEEYRFKPAINVAEFDITQNHTRASYTNDIKDLKNSVRAIIKSNNKGNLPAIEVTVSDSESIGRFGKLSSKIEVESSKAAEIESLAKTELSVKNKSSRKISCEMVGAINARVNRVMNFVDSYTGLNAKMRIVDINHSLNGGVYKMSVSLEYIEGTGQGNVATVTRIEREDAQEVMASGEVKDLIKNAQKYIGVPYVWGGYSPSGFDCSGFVCYVLNESGYNIGRTTAQGLYDMCEKVTSPKTGDLVFWTGTNPKSSNFITHVGIYVGNGKNIQASDSGVKVCKDSGVYSYGRLK